MQHKSAPIWILGDPADMEDGGIATALTRLGYKAFHRDGSRIYVESRARPIINKNAVEGVINIVRDVTPQKRLEHTKPAFKHDGTAHDNQRHTKGASRGQARRQKSGGKTEGPAGPAGQGRG